MKKLSKGANLGLKREKAVVKNTAKRGWGGLGGVKKPSQRRASVHGKKKGGMRKKEKERWERGGGVGGGLRNNTEPTEGLPESVTSLHRMGLRRIWQRKHL